MIKKLLVAIMIALPTMAFAQKFGIVNTSSIIPELPEFKSAQTEFETASKKYDDEFKNLQAEAQKAMDEYLSTKSDSGAADDTAEEATDDAAADDAAADDAE